MKKNILRIFLFFCLLMEVVLALLIFIKPAAAFELFRVSYNNETAFLGFIIAWFCLLISAFCVWALVLLQKEKQGYYMLINLLSFFWIGIGIGIYLRFSRTENLLSDSLKGLILLILNHLYSKNISETK